MRRARYELDSAAFRVTSWSQESSTLYGPLIGTLIARQPLFTPVGHTHNPVYSLGLQDAA